MKLHVNKQIFSDIINLQNNVFKLLKIFQKLSFIQYQIIFLQKIIFFPIPVLFPVDKIVKNYK